MTILNALSQALSQIEATYGAQACLDHCDAIYSGTYRCPESFTVGSEPELQSEMIGIVAEFLAIKAGVYTRPQPIARVYCDCEDDCYCDDSYDYDNYDDREPIDQFIDTATSLVANNVPFVLLCNYKGEGDGIALLEEVKHLRIYISKFNYQ